MRKRLDGMLMRHAVDRRVAVSEAVAEQYRRHLGVDGVTVIPNGFDTAALALVAPADLGAWGLDPHRPTLVALGRMVPEKAHADLIAA